jgi:type VI secretion system protein ImpF
MARTSGKPRFSAPLMHVFRSAHEARAARTESDGEAVDGETIARSRRIVREGLNERALREEVSINLGYLLNTIRLEAAQDLSDFPYVARSILNFGVPDIASIAMVSSAVDTIPAAIVEAVRRFEPRLIPSTVQCRRDESVEAHTLNIRFHVSGDLDCDPVAVPVSFVADIDLHSAKVRMARG